MLHVHDAIRQHLLARHRPPDDRFTFEALWRSEWSPRFERLMRNRLVIGAFRYGLLNSPVKPAFDRMGYIKVKIDRYVKTGNREALVDVANLCLLEFEEGKHPKGHFSSMDDTAEHCGKIQGKYFCDGCLKWKDTRGPSGYCDECERGPPDSAQADEAM